MVCTLWDMVYNVIHVYAEVELEEDPMINTMELHSSSASAQEQIVATSEQIVAIQTVSVPPVLSIEVSAPKIDMLGGAK